MEEKIESTKHKIYIKNKKKFIIFSTTIIFCIIVVLVILIINSNKKIKVDSSTNLSTLNSKKYSKEILNEYNKENMKEIFCKDYESLQNKIAIYIFDNSTTNENSFKALLEKVNKELYKKEYKMFGENELCKWNGKWSVEDKGSVKFKFDSKEIEPKWVDDTEILNKIIKN